MNTAIQLRHDIQTPTGVMDSEVPELGAGFITKLHVLMKISRTYDPKNVLVHQPMQEVLEAINSLIRREGYFSLEVLKEDLSLNRQRLSYSVEGLTNFKQFLTLWKKRLIGQVIFKEPLDENRLRNFISSFLELEEGCKENAVLLRAQLVIKGVSSVEVKPLETVEAEEPLMFLRGDEQDLTKIIFFEIIGSMKEVMRQIKEHQQADLRRLKTLFRHMVHLITEDDSVLLGLASIKNYEGYLFNHSVNVAIYCLAMGRRLGLMGEELTNLGMAALLHDIGMSKVPKEILDKPATLTEGERRLAEEHPVTGAEILLNFQEWDEIDPKIIIGIFDHHLKSDLSGYPGLFRKKDVSLFGRIIQIADSYDAMTTPKIYKKLPYTPEEALSIMLKKKVSNFDPILLKILIGTVGIHPVGSLVLLDSGEKAIVHRSNTDPAWIDRPQVILISTNGHGDEKKEILDLTEMDAESRFKRTIVKPLDPHQYGIVVTKYFL